MSMNEFKYQFVNFLLLALLGFGIYWAFTTIDNGIIYDRDDIVTNQDGMADSSPENTSEDVALFDTTTTPIVNDASQTEQEQEEVEEEKPEPQQEEKPSAEKVLMEKLQNLAGQKLNIDNGSNGESVGYIQKFLALYFKDKKIVVDKSFGPTTKGLVKQFQQKELGGGDGRVGPNTVKGMIRWLQKNS